MTDYQYDQPVSTIAAILTRQIKASPQSRINFYWIGKNEITFGFSLESDSAALFYLPMTSYFFHGGNKEAIIETLNCLLTNIIPQLMEKEGRRKE